MFGAYSLVLFVHVVAAVALVGHALTAPVSRALMQEAAALGDLRVLLAFEQRASRWIPTIAVLLLGTGFYLGSVGWWTQPWFHLSVAAWAANSVIAARVLRPILGQLAAAAGAAASGPIPPAIDFLRRSTRLAVASQVMLANDLGLLYLMMNKPAFLGSLAALALANGALVGLVLLPRRAAAPALTEMGS